jgi:hypothetical protein
MKDWEVVADNLKKAVWSLRCTSAVDSQARTLCVRTRWNTRAWNLSPRRTDIRWDKVTADVARICNKMQPTETEKEEVAVVRPDGA